MGDRVLARTELNRNLLARQALAEPPATAELPALLDAVGGIQAQYAPSMYIGVWSRLAGFRSDALTAALWSGTVVQGTLQRATIHLVSASDYWPTAIALRDRRRAWWIRSLPAAERDVDHRRALEAVFERLADGPATQTEPAAAGAEAVARRSPRRRRRPPRVPPAGTWGQRRANR